MSRKLVVVAGAAGACIVAALVLFEQGAQPLERGREVVAESRSRPKGGQRPSRIRRAVPKRAAAIPDKPKIPYDVVPAGPPRPPKTRAQHLSFIEGCLKPRAAQITRNLDGYYRETVRRLADSDKPLKPHEDALARRVAMAMVEHRLAINNTLIDLALEGRLPAAPAPAEGRVDYIIEGSIGWAHKPGQVWGPKGAQVEINYALRADEHPHLRATRGAVAEARRTLREALDNKRRNKK